jgi:hypothetical protein|tara:strand:- start:1014 stop:1541 length:528 start_codon:yes stop_codon:yes gene_type:complete
VIKIKSDKTINLKKEIIISICQLKDSHWKHGLKSQLSHFKKYIKNKDIHNLLLVKKKIVGYTAFRLRKFRLKNKESKYLLLDTIIVEQKFRKKKYTNSLMKFNNSFIKKKKLPSFLICTKKNSLFFKKYKWNFLNKRNYNVIGHKKFDVLMGFNLSRTAFNEKKLSNKVKIFFNK